MLNSPVNDPKKKLLAITELEDYRRDPDLTDGEADKTEYLFFDTPTVLNENIYQDLLMKHYSGVGLTVLI